MAKKEKHDDGRETYEVQDAAGVRHNGCRYALGARLRLEGFEAAALGEAVSVAAKSKGKAAKSEPAED